MMWRALCGLLMGLVMTVNAQSPSSLPQISLLTFQPGEVYWQRYGHNALRVVDARGEHVYNYGIFDFQQKNFALNFARGRMQYRLAVEPMQYTLAVYAQEGRWVHEQVLDFTPEEARRVAQFLANNARPANAEYRYDYFAANCSTKVRDVINMGANGAVQATLDPVMTLTSYRSEAARMMSPLPPVMWFTDLLLGPSTDRSISLWQRSFLPEILMASLRDVRFADGRPLVRSEQTLLPGRLPDTPESPPTLAFAFALAGLAWGAVLLLLDAVARSGLRVRRIAHLKASVFVVISAVISGLIGWILLLGWAVTDHLVMANNLTLLAFSPLSLLALPFMVRALRGTPVTSGWGLMLLILPTVTTITALALQLMPGAQQHLHWLLFWLPVHLASLTVVFRGTKPA